MPISSPHPDVTIPDTAITPFVFADAASRADRPALIDMPSGREVTFGELADRVRRFAGALSERGFGSGDTLAVYMPNLPEYAIAFHGTILAGGTVTTINPVYNAEEVAFQLKDAGARFLVTIADSLPVAREAGNRVGIEEIFVAGDAEGITTLASLLESDPLDEDPEVDAAADVAALPYSSGTTGHPKGVMLTHRNLVANIRQCHAAMGIGEDEVFIGVLPFFHIYGMQVILNLGLERGATVATMPRFDLEGFLRGIQEHKVTRAFVVPPIALALAKHPLVDQYDLSSLRMLMSGAAPLGSELEEACAARLGCRVLQGYGMTETGPVTHVIPLDGGSRPGSIGPSVPNTESRIVDPESGQDVETGERGELWVRGPQVMSGYLGNEEATRSTIDDDGWLHTGDIAIADEDGWFAIVDRLKELIKFKGFQVAPAELEALLLSHPAISDAAVIPVPDEEAGEIPKAYVVLGSELTPEEIMAFVAEKVSTYKRVRQVEIIDEIPKSASGKILRRVLKDRERAAAGG